jgi:hypothetical protein
LKKDIFKLPSILLTVIGGGMDQYISEGLNLTEEDIDKIRNYYLE